MKVSFKVEFLFLLFERSVKTFFGETPSKKIKAQSKGRITVIHPCGRKLLQEKTALKEGLNHNQILPFYKQIQI